ncbi:MAG: pyrimidine-nucleoside phosphorylase [Firmicutes bacterium]|nr:pyrimidine-nucleoside phosphorylase [Bacillota bacterium]
MRAYDLIWKKRQGGELTAEEIKFLISGYVSGSIPDYQMSAWLMAVYFQGMTFDECTALTLEMAHSGEMIDLSSIPGIKADKHSSGGVGDKTTLVLAPLVAAAGIPVAKMSGRGLGHTGGTIDKFESIPGFTTSLPLPAFLDQVRRIGVAIAGQTGNLVPADKKIYALRDLTATVESIPLIASSIVSKKLAAGADVVVLDVKYGSGAFMGSLPQAIKLAETMVEIGNRAGRRFKAVLSDMSQPLGQAIGNSLEVAEAIQTLQGKGPADLTELSLVLGGYMVWLAKGAKSPEAGREILEKLLRSGQGLAKFRALAAAQGGNPEVVDDLTLLPTAPVVLPITSVSEGWVAGIDCRALGIAAMKLGAGRNQLGDKIKPEVGLKVYPKTGDFVPKGAVIAEIFASSVLAAEAAAPEIQAAFQLSPRQQPARKLIEKVI